MKNARLFLLVLLLATAVLLSACSGRALASSWPGITVAGDVVYVAYNQHIYALNASNGVEQWRYPREPEGSISFYAPPAVTPDGQIIAAGYDHVLYGLDENGVQQWRFSEAENRYIGAPLATEEGIFAPNADYRLYALSLSGDELWPPFETNQAQWAQPASDGETLFLPAMDHNLYALDAHTGELLWAQDLGAAVVGAPVLDNGTLYVGTFGSQVFAIDKETGDILWSADTEDWIWAGASYADEVLYVGDLSGRLYAFNALTGRELWRYDQGDGTITGAPLVLEGVVYFATDAGSLFAVQAEGGSGKRITTFEGQFYGAAVPAGDLILVAVVNADTVLIALDRDGNQVWAFAPES